MKMYYGRGSKGRSAILVKSTSIPVPSAKDFKRRLHQSDRMQVETVGMIHVSKPLAISVDDRCECFKVQGICLVCMTQPAEEQVWRARVLSLPQQHTPACAHLYVCSSTRCLLSQHTRLPLDWGKMHRRWQFLSQKHHIVIEHWFSKLLGHSLEVGFLEHRMMDGVSFSSSYSMCISIERSMHQCL